MYQFVTNEAAANWSNFKLMVGCFSFWFVSALWNKFDVLVDNFRTASILRDLHDGMINDITCT
jgi:hypothetical protein